MTGMRPCKMAALFLLVISATAVCCSCGISHSGGTPVQDMATEQEKPTEAPHQKMDNHTFFVIANGTTFTADFANNSSAEALKELLQKNDITIDMQDYGNFEKVGGLGASLPTNDESITTEAGDVILYQGNQITIYYDTNAWSFTRLGKICNATKTELLRALGDGNVTVTLSLNK